MTQQTEALAEDKIINMTQEVGECGATRVHQLGGDTLTIFKDNELFEFARKCAALSSQPPAPTELSGMIQAVNAAIQETIVAARDCQGVPHIYGRSTPDWDDGYLQGIQCCATIVQAAMHHSARASLTATAGSTP